MGRTYFNHGITGNGRLLATFTNKGELNRVFWPSPDYYQHINNIHVGIKFDESQTKFLNDNLWYIEQSYDGDSNILVTSYENSDMGLKIYQRDFVPADKDVLIRNYEVKNISKKDMNISIFLYTDFISDPMNVRNGFMNFDNNCAVIYNKESAITILSDLTCKGFQFGNSKEAIINDRLYGKDDIAMTSDMGMKWEIGEVKENEEKKINLFFSFDKTIQESMNKAIEIKDEPVKNMIGDAKKYWEKYYKQHNVIKTDNEKIDNIYKKCLLTFALFSNKETGAILAGAEIDENFTRCGRYGYCWPRDGVFITKAFDICGMSEEAEKFYTVWAKKAQLPTGEWQQRYFLDGTLGPSWGLQLDETAAIIYGIYEHYKYTGKIEFLEEMWGGIKDAVNFLIKNIDKETGLPKASYDLWEERLGEHTYSAAAVVASLKAAGEIAKELKIDDIISNIWCEEAEKIKKSIEEKLWNDNDKKFLRGIRTRLNWWNCGTVEIKANDMGYTVPVAEIDNTVDISLLGLTVPFGVFDVKDEKIKKTVKAIEERLDGFPSGGYGRYEYDSYIGGNPWIISTLWLAMYYIEAGDIEKGKNLFMWAVKGSSKLGFLPEQVDKLSGEPAWVMQLSWSCAMFIIVLDKLKKK